MNPDMLIDQVVEQARHAPPMPPTEWVMAGMTLQVGTVTHNGATQKALIFFHASAPDAIRFVFPMSQAGAKAIGDQLADRPTILTPGI